MCLPYYECLLIVVIQRDCINMHIIFLYLIVCVYALYTYSWSIGLLSLVIFYGHGSTHLTYLLQPKTKVMHRYAMRSFLKGSGLWTRILILTQLMLITKHFPSLKMLIMKKGYKLLALKCIIQQDSISPIRRTPYIKQFPHIQCFCFKNYRKIFFLL